MNHSFIKFEISNPIGQYRGSTSCPENCWEQSRSWCYCFAQTGTTV